MLKFELVFLKFFRDFRCSNKLHLLAAPHVLKHFRIKIESLIWFLFDNFKQFSLSIHFLIDCTFFFKQIINFLLWFLFRLTIFYIYSLGFCKRDGFEEEFECLDYHKHFRYRIMALANFGKDEKLTNKLYFSQMLDDPICVNFACVHRLNNDYKIVIDIILYNICKNIPSNQKYPKSNVILTRLFNN